MDLYFDEEEADLNIVFETLENSVVETKATIHFSKRVTKVIPFPYLIPSYIRICFDEGINQEFDSYAYMYLSERISYVYGYPLSDKDAGLPLDLIEQKAFRFMQANVAYFQNKRNILVLPDMVKSFTAAQFQMLPYPLQYILVECLCFDFSTVPRNLTFFVTPSGTTFLVDDSFYPPNLSQIFTGRCSVLEDRSSLLYDVCCRSGGDPFLFAQIDRENIGNLMFRCMFQEGIEKFIEAEELMVDESFFERKPNQEGKLSLDLYFFQNLKKVYLSGPISELSVYYEPYRQEQEENDRVLELHFDNFPIKLFQDEESKKVLLEHKVFIEECLISGEDIKMGSVLAIRLKLFLDHLRRPFVEDKKWQELTEGLLGILPEKKEEIVSQEKVKKLEAMKR